MTATLSKADLRTAALAKRDALSDEQRTAAAQAMAKRGVPFTIEPGMVVPTIEAWLARLPHRSDPLVIVDTLGKVMPPATPGESAYARDYRVAGRLKRIADDHPGMALVVLHHDRKTEPLWLDLVVRPVADGARRPQRGPAAAYRFQKLINPRDVEERLLLSSKGGVRQILGRCG